MDADSIMAAHQASNRLPRVHPAQHITAPDGQQVAIDEHLVPLMRALWAAGVQTVASCQNVREYVTTAWPEELRETLADTGPLTHADSTRHGHGYVRLILDDTAVPRFLKAAAEHLTRRRQLQQLVQIEFPLEALPHISHAAIDARSGGQP